MKTVTTFYLHLSALLFLVEDGTELKLSGRLRQTSDGLELSYLTGADSGQYRCEAKNNAGSRSSEATLLVHGECETCYKSIDLLKNLQDVIIY